MFEGAVVWRWSMTMKTMMTIETMKAMTTMKTLTTLTTMTTNQKTRLTSSDAADCGWPESTLADSPTLRRPPSVGTAASDSDVAAHLAVAVALGWS